jgi:hypothetical protein
MVCQRCAPADTDKLNAKSMPGVLTPDSDHGSAWSRDLSALENNGVVQITGKTFNTTTQPKLDYEN